MDSHGRERSGGSFEKRRERQLEVERQKEALYRKEQEARKLEEWKKDPCYEMPSLCDKVMAYDKTLGSGGDVEAAEALSEELVIPNVHEGRVTLEILKKWGREVVPGGGSGPPAQWHTCEVEALREIGGNDGTGFLRGDTGGACAQPEGSDGAAVEAAFL